MPRKKNSPILLDEDPWEKRMKELREKQEREEQEQLERKEKGKKMLKVIVAVLVIALLGVFVCPVGCTNVDPTDGAVKVNKMGNSIDPEPWGVGFHFYNRWMTDVETYKVATRSFPGDAGTSELSDEYTMELKTSDGQNVNVDMTLLYSLRMKELPMLHSKIGRNYESEVLMPQMKSEARLAFGAYAAEDIYQGKVREQIQRQVLEKLQESLAKTNSTGELMYPSIQVTDVLVRHLSFSKDFERAIEQKKLASQQVEINRQMALAEEEKAKQIEATARGEKMKVLQQAEGEGQSAETRAKGEAAAIKVKADAMQYQLECEAKGNLAKYTAEAEGKRLSAQALAGAGGEQVVALEFAKNIPPTLQTYAIPAGANINAICGNMKDLLPSAFAAPKAAK